MRIAPATRFTDHLQSLGIPIHGVTADARIDFKEEATAQQRLAARNAAENFDWSEMESRNPAEVEIDVSLLTTAQRQALLSRIIAEYLIDHPRLAAALGVIVTKKV